MFLFSFCLKGKPRRCVRAAAAAATASSSVKRIGGKFKWHSFLCVSRTHRNRDIRSSALSYRAFTGYRRKTRITLRTENNWTIELLLLLRLWYICRCFFQITAKPKENSLPDLKNRMNGGEQLTWVCCCIDLDTLGDARKIHEKVDVPSEPIYASSVFMYVGLRCNYFPDSTRRGDVEAGTQQSNSRCTSFYTF